MYENAWEEFADTMETPWDLITFQQCDFFNDLHSDKIALVAKSNENFLMRQRLIGLRVADPEMKLWAVLDKVSPSPAISVLTD